MMQDVQQPRPRRGRDFVLPEVPILESPEWSDEDDEINLTRTPLSVETEARAPAARLADNRPMLSPAMDLPPMVRGASPPSAHQMAPPLPGFNHPCSYEAAWVSDRRNANEGNHRSCANRKANGGGDTDDGTTPCSGDAARKQDTTLNVGPRECWPVDGHNGDDSDSPPQMSIASFVSARGRGCFPFEVGSLFVSSTHHLGGGDGNGDDESSSAATGSSNSSSDTDRTRTSSDSTDSSSYYQQQRASMGPFSHGSTQVEGLLGGGGCPQQPSAPSYGIEVGPSVFVRMPQQNPSLLATPVVVRTGLITAAEAAPSIFRTFFHEEDGSYDMTGFHHDSASASHQDDVAAPSMTLSAASARAANGGARVAVSCSREGRTDATNSAAAGTHQDSSNHTITTASGDGGLQRVPHSNRRQGSFFTTVDEALYETHTHPTAPRSPNAGVLVSTDASPMHPTDAFQASRGATEPQHQHQGATHNGNNNSRDTRRRRMQPVSWHSSPPEKTSTQLSGIHAALAEYVLLPRREVSPMMPSVATGKSTPASNSGVGDANHKGDTQDGDKDSRPQEHGTRFLESADPKPDILLGRDVMEGGTRDKEGGLYPSMVWIKAKQLSSAPSSVPTPHSSAKPNTKRLNFRSRITPRGHGAAAAPVAGATASNQAPVVSERRCTDSTASSLEAPDGTGFGATCSATNCTPDAGGGGRIGHNAVVMDWDEYGLLAWAVKSPLRTCLESAAAFGARGGDGGAGAANEPVKVTDSVASHTTRKKATLPISMKASSTKPTRRWTDKVRPRRGESPHTAVTFVEETGPFGPVNDDATPSSGATRAVPPCKPALSTPPHLLATMAAVATEFSRPQSPPTASLLSPTTYSMLAVTTGKVAGSSTPAATAPSSSVSGEPSVATTAAGPRAAPSHTLSRPDEYFFNSFHTNLIIAGSVGDEDNASDAVLASPLPNMSNPAGAEGHTTSAYQRRLSSISGGSRQDHPTIPSFQWLGQERQQRNGGRTGPHILIPSSSASSSAAAASTSAASAALAWRGMTDARGSALATLKDDYELLTVGTDVTSVNGGGTGGFVALEARANLSAEAQTSPANLGRVASRRPIIEDPREVGSVDNSRRRSEPASIVSAEEVQPPRNRRKSSHWRLHASPVDR